MLAPTKANEKHIRDYLLAALSLLAGYLAVKYGASWLAWAAALMFWMAIYDYTKAIHSRLIRLGAPICAGLILILVMLTITDVSWSRWTTNQVPVLPKPQGLQSPPADDAR